MIGVTRPGAPPGYRSTMNPFIKRAGVRDRPNTELATAVDQALVLAEQHAGSMDRYLAEVLGVDAAARQRLAQRYLEG